MRRKVGDGRHRQAAPSGTRAKCALVIVSGQLPVARATHSNSSDRTNAAAPLIKHDHGLYLERHLRSGGGRIATGVRS